MHFAMSRAADLTETCGPGSTHTHIDVRASLLVAFCTVSRGRTSLGGGPLRAHSGAVCRSPALPVRRPCSLVARPHVGRHHRTAPPCRRCRCRHCCHCRHCRCCRRRCCRRRCRRRRCCDIRGALGDVTRCSLRRLRLRPWPRPSPPPREGPGPCGTGHSRGGCAARWCQGTRPRRRRHS